MEPVYREMMLSDYEACYALWSATSGMALSDADSPEAIDRYLQRNPGCSFVCESGGRLLGTLLGGHDGRRGYIYHAAVALDQRGQGIGGQLVRRSLDNLRKAGIQKCHLFVIEDNEIGSRFWAHSGWERRDGILLYSAAT
ncbi:GNAT family N-acetyltransferase [Paenibacillus sp. R14(2021)]|uniref:GNAT family N-acetyltransferase n=1 Tax=Paenibacillus sp. R14(2021) TaxID=2859228 RepID=UPI001C61632C|nr:GNAT family N-acetyltransferase [Paenibacillus sp. R14(2021)]